MTDREAIKRLACQFHAYLLGADQSDVRRRVMGLIDALAEPAAPTVTREQAQEMRRLAVGWLCESRDWPAFFRAVADQLDKEE